MNKSVYINRSMGYFMIDVVQDANLNKSNKTEVLMNIKVYEF